MSRDILQTYSDLGWQTVLDCGYHPVRNPDRDYDKGKVPAFTGWPTLRPSPEEGRAWRAAEGWIGLAVPPGHVALDIDDPEAVAWFELNRQPDWVISKTRKGYHVLFAVPEGVHLTAATHLSNAGIKITYRCAGKSQIVVAPSPEREWRGGSLHKIPVIPEFFLPAPKANPYAKPAPSFRPAEDMNPGARAIFDHWKEKLINAAVGTRAETGYHAGCAYGALDAAGRLPSGRIDEGRELARRLNKEASEGFERGLIWGREHPLPDERTDTRPPSIFVPSFPDDPEPILRPDPRVDPIPLPRGLLPITVEDLAFELQEKHGADAVIFAWTALAIIGGLLGNKRRLRVSSDQMIRANLYLAIIADPAGMKSPMMHRAARPAIWLEKQIRERMEEVQQVYERDLLVWNSEKAGLEKRLKGAAGREREEIAERLRDGAPPAPVCPQFMISDATVEALVQGCQNNPNGVILFVDELQFLLNQLGKKGFETLRPILLEFFESFKPFIDNRLGRKSLFVPAPVLSVAGGIQQQLADRFLGASDDGLAERFLFAVPAVKPWNDSDESVDPDKESAYFHAVVSIPGTNPQQIGCAYDETGEFWFHSFDEEARALWRAWRNFTEIVKRLPAWHGRTKLHGWFGKVRTLAGKIALIIHATEGRIGAVEASTLERAIALAVVAFSHAESAFTRFGGEGGEAMDPPAVLLADLLRREQTESFLPWKIAERDLSGLGAPSVTMAVEELHRLGWLSLETIQTKGRPSSRYHVNPKLHLAPFRGLQGSFWVNEISKHFLSCFQKYPSLQGFVDNVYKSPFNMDYYYIYTNTIDIPRNGETAFQNEIPEVAPCKLCKVATNEQYPGNPGLNERF